MGSVALEREKQILERIDNSEHGRMPYSYICRDLNDRLSTEILTSLSDLVKGGSLQEFSSIESIYEITPVGKKYLVKLQKEI